MGQHGQVTIRDATEADIAAIIKIAKATGQDEDWTTVYPAYLRHLIAHGRLLIGERDGQTIGFGGTRQIGAGPSAISMLTDLFVDPASHGQGTGRALLDVLWGDRPRKMTFSSLHDNALPLYTRFGADAWWPLLYLGGEASRLECPPGWSAESAEPAEVGALELTWTGVDRTADHAMWAARPHGASVIASRNGRPAGAATVGGVGAEYGISHMAVTGADLAADAVIAVLSWLRPADGRAHVCLPAPHPAVRRLLAAGWKVSDVDLYMASEPGLIDPHRSVPSPALA